MKTFSYEELQELITHELLIPNNPKIITVMGAFNPYPLKFLQTSDDMILEFPWRGNPVKISKGDYIHANPKDIYTVSSKNFQTYYKKI